MPPPFQPQPFQPQPSRIFQTFLALIAATLLLTASKAHAADSIYACFGSTSSDPQTACAKVNQRAEIMGLSMGGTNLAGYINGVFTSAKPVLSNIALVKVRDLTSDTLLANVNNGKLIPYVAIAIYDAGSAKPAINILLTNVSVTSTIWGTSGGVSAPISESVTLAFQKLALTDNVTHQSITWNIATQAPTLIRSPAPQ